jgi:hypothetical protein
MHNPERERQRERGREADTLVELRTDELRGGLRCKGVGTQEAEHALVVGQQFAQQMVKPGVPPRVRKRQKPYMASVKTERDVMGEWKGTDMQTGMQSTG